MPQKQIQSFSSFGVLPFVVAGLFDSINPCSFTMIVLFIAVFSFLLARKTTILISGICFVATVFLTTFYIELGSFESFRRLEIFFLLSKTIYLLVALLSIFLGLIHLRDWWVYKKDRDPKKLFFKLPSDDENETKKHSFQKDKIFCLLMAGIVAAVSGFATAMLNSTCQGQVYFSSLIYVYGAERWKTIISIVLYSLALMIPFLVVSFFVLYFIVSGKYFEVVKKYLSKVKIISSAVFLSLGLGLLYMFGSFS